MLQPVGGSELPAAVPCVIQVHLEGELMVRILALLLIGSLFLLAGGCSGEKQPEADPNFKTSTDPSDIVVPPSMKKPPAPPPR